MKKFILMAGLLFCGVTQAQLISATGDGQSISNGQVFTFNTLDEATATLDIQVTNISDSPIDLKLRCESIQNSDGQEIQFCFGGQCHFSVTQGKVVPAGVTVVTLQPGQSNIAEDHFFNENAGINTDADVIYEISVVRYSSGTAVEPPLLTFFYKYNAEAMGTGEIASLQNTGINVKNTVVKNMLDIDAEENAKLEVFNMNGQMIKSAVISNGSQSIDLSAFTTGVYIARFTTETNKTSQVRIIKN